MINWSVTYGDHTESISARTYTAALAIARGLGLAADASEVLSGAELEETKAIEAIQKAEEARRSARDKQEIAAVESELAMLAAQLAAIRRLRKK